MNGDHLVRDTSRKRGLFGRLIVVAVIAVAAIFATGVFLSQTRRTPFTDDPRFVVTGLQQQSYDVQPGASVGERLAAIRRFLFQPNDWSKATFTPTPMRQSSVYGLLEQCTTIDGVHYVVEKGLSGGTFFFGHTNFLNATNWTIAVKEALSTGYPEWTDAVTGAPRKGSLVFVTNSPNTVLVVSQEMAAELKEQTASPTR